MSAIQDWLDEYAVSHRHPVNKALHWICVPLIVLAVIGFLAGVPAPTRLARVTGPSGWACVAGVAALVYYARLSPRLALGMTPVFVLLAVSVHVLATLAVPLWQSCLAIFVVAWIGQFIGHAIEGRRPSFMKDVQFLLIGPLWLLAAAYRRAGIRY